MRSLRGAGRILVLLGAISASVAVGWHTHRRYESDIRRAYAAIEESATETVETSIGTVEYCTRGDGVPVLVLHGIVGGFDQATQTGESLLETDAHLVGVSRFGYLGSELPEEATPENQARAYVEVLDDLGVDDVVVIGASASGAPAIRFALDYPDRTRGLVLIGSTAPNEPPLVGPTGPPHAILQDPVFWLLVNHAPRAFHALFGIDRDDYRSASSSQGRSVFRRYDRVRVARWLLDSARSAALLGGDAPRAAVRVATVPAPHPAPVAPNPRTMIQDPTKARRSIES